MKPVAVFHLSVMIVFLPDLDDQIIGFFVFKAHEIELIGIGLAGMPDLIKVGVDSHVPAQNQGIKICFVHPFLNKHRPLQKIGADIDADLFPGILGNGQNGLSKVVAAVGDQGELKSFSVFFKPAVLVPFPAGFLQELQSPFGIIGKRIDDCGCNNRSV